MKKISVVMVTLLSIIFFLPFLFRTSYKKNKPYIVCTTSIIADMVLFIVRDQMEVKTLMGPGVDPHIYRPRESDVQALSEADLIFYNGLHLEGKMGDMFARMQSRILTIALADALLPEECLASDFEGLYDPHIWHDVLLWKKTVPFVLRAICAIDSERSDIYTHNAEQYISRLDRVHCEVVEKVAKLSSTQKELLTAHDAFAYFGRAYGFNVVGLQGISTDAIVSTRDIQKMADRIAQKKINAIFLESSIPSKSIEAVQKAVEARGWCVVIAPELFSDSLGDKTTTADTYCGMITHNVDVIVDSLSQPHCVSHEPKNTSSFYS